MGWLRRLAIRLTGRTRIDGGSEALAAELAGMLSVAGIATRVYAGHDPDGLAMSVVEDIYGTPLLTVSGRPVRRGYLVVAAPLDPARGGWFFAFPGSGLDRDPAVLDETLSIIVRAGLVGERE